MSMIEPLQELIGLTIVEAMPVHDYVQLRFEQDATLTIFNPYQYTIELKPSANVSSLSGRKLAEVSEVRPHIRLAFTDERVVLIDMSNEAYQGPEAMTLIRQGRPIVVWRIDDN